MTSTVLVALAVTAPTVKATDVDLDDSGVWVTGTDSGVLGQMNHEIGQSAMRITVQGGDYDVVQDGATVLYVDRKDPQVRRVSVVDRRFAADGVPVPAGAVVALGGGVLAVADPATGKIWTGSGDSAGLRAPTEGRPSLTSGKGAVVTVGPDGAVHAVSADPFRLTTVRPDGEGGFTDPAVDDLEGSTPDALQVAAVGETPVVLAVSGGRVQVDVPGRETVDLVGADPRTVRLQLSGEASSEVFVVDAGHVYAVPLDGGRFRTVLERPVDEASTETGDMPLPPRPVQLGGCVYAVWSGVPTYATACSGGQGRASEGGWRSGADLVFRVNRRRVLVNERRTGDVYLTDDPKTNVAQWTTMQQRTTTETSEDTTTSSTLKFTDRSRVNTPPETAPDDRFGVRPGGTALLPVLANDKDADGDLLTASVPDDQQPAPGSGRFDQVDGGRLLQVTARADRGSIKARYVADDGRSGGKTPGTVTVKVVPEPTNSGPKPLQDAGNGSRTQVLSGGAVSYDVLADWYDPEGDPLTLECPTQQGLRCRPDGVLTYRDAGGGRSTTTAEVSVVDDHGAKASGKVRIDVVAPDQKDPLLRPDLVHGTVGVPVVVRPLENDTAFSLEPLRLQKVQSYDASVTYAVGSDGTVTLTGKRPAKAYLVYTATAGGRTSRGLLRFDVVPKGGSSPPVASPDSAMLRPTRPTVVDVLANDSDADGDVLVVTDAAVQDPTAAALVRVEVVGHRLLRLTSQAGLAKPVVLRYTVSDGTTPVQGTVQLRPAPPADANQAPVAKDDEAAVRAGQVLDVAVLANDRDPEGEPLRLDPKLIDVAFRPTGGGTGDAVAFTSGSRVRVFAPAKPGRVVLTYTTRDVDGRPDSAAVTVRVVGADAPNNPPRPGPLEARTTSGRSVAIPVPLSGIDPDGDTTTLAPPVDQGTLGTVRRDPSRPDVLVYTARPDARGTDEFRYAVVDAAGATGTGVVRVGVADPGPDHPPVAVDDTLTVRSDRNRTIAVAVTANDTDPDGDPVVLATGQGAVVSRTPGVAASAKDGGVTTSIRKGAPDRTLVSYRITAAGVPADAPGLLTIVPSPTAPPLPPVARDDVAAPGATTVAVLENDSDPDGNRGELRIASGKGAVGPAGVASRADDTHLAVVPGPTDRWAWYTVTDADGETASAFVLVPGSLGPPRLRPDAPKVTMKSGETRTLTLSDFVEAPSGKPVRITTDRSISGSGVTASANSPTAIVVRATIQHGPAAVTFEAVDADRPEAAGARRAYVTIPITVEGATNRAPVLKTRTLTVARGEKQPQTLDLESVTDDDTADVGRHSYTLKSAPGNGIRATLNGSVLTVDGETASPGATVALQVTVKDAKLSATGTVTVKVVETLRPQPQATDCTPRPGEKVKSGTPLVVDLATCTVNPFQGEAPLVVSPVSLDARMGSAVVAGTKVTVSIAAGFVGRLVGTYTVTDKVGRTASARILVDVVDLPGKPGAPQLANPALQESAQATIRWQAADPRGSTIEKYVVTDRSKGFSQDCQGDVTQCTLTGLRNTIGYNFRVAAWSAELNAAGQESDPSATITPDQRPDPPQGLTATEGDGSVLLSWKALSGGSAVSRYAVTYQGTDGTNGSASGAVSSTAATATVSGLTNGVGYTFTVVQSNAAQNADSDPTSTSAPVYPRGAVRTVPTPQAAAGSDLGGGVIDVTWSPAAVQSAANGRITAMEVVVSGGGSETRTVDVAAGQATFSGLDVTKESSFVLRVTNNLPSTGTSQAAVATAEGTPAKATFSGAPTAGDQKATVTFSNVVANGTSVKSMKVFSGGTSVAVPPTNGSGPYTVAVPGLTNGTAYTFQVEVCNNTRCTTSDLSPSVTPFGAPIVPQPSVGGNGLQVTGSWGAINWNGAAPGTVSVAMSNTPACNQSAAPGSCSFSGSPSTTYTLTVTARNSAGQQTSASNARTTPNPIVSLYKGPSASVAGCTTTYCARVGVTLDNFAPNTTYNVRLTSREGPFVAGATDYGNFNVTTDGSGHVSHTSQAVYGYPGGWVQATVNGVVGRITW